MSTANESAAADDQQQPSTQPTDALSSDVAHVEDVGNDGVRKYKLTDEATAMAFLAELESGSSLREAASNHGLNLRTAQRIVARSHADLDATRESFRRLMQAEALDRLDDWRTAADVGARKKGNHAPAKEWLLHAGVIEPLDTDHNQVRVSIHIGTPEQPMKIVSPLTIAAEQATTTSSGQSVATDVATENRPESGSV